MKKNILFFVLIVFTNLTWAQERSIKGIITDGTNPIENVKIAIENTENTVFTNTKGEYEIIANKGDIVVFSSIGLKEVKIKVEDVTTRLNLVMTPDVQELEEVTVEASKRRSQQELSEDYFSNKNIIKTAYGYLDADRISGKVRMLSEDEINPVGLCLLDLLRNRFSGIRVVGNCTSGKQTFGVGSISTASLTGGAVFIRGGGSLTNSNPAIFDVDGQIFTNVPIWVDINNIKRIAILGNLASTVAYGNLGDGGVIVVNTITGTAGNNKIVDQARLRNNFLSSAVLSREKVFENEPTYLKELYKSSSLDEARNIYGKFEATYSNSPYFILDAYKYFSSKNDDNFAKLIITENQGLFQDNPVLLKALAYMYDFFGNHTKANETYKEIFVQRPNYVQSYMDLANSYRDLDTSKQAASIYSRYQYLVQEGFLSQDSIGFDPIISREFNNLLLLDKNTIVNKSKNQLFVAEEEFKGTRLVFEWNDSEAEFDLQFVNPENQYYLWKHSLADSQEEIKREKDFGYNVKEYLLDNSLPGTWKVNITYYGNKSLTPTYLKATIYENYGTHMQNKTVQLFKLGIKGVNHELFTVNSPLKVVSR